MQLLSVEVVGSICVVKDTKGQTVLEIIGERINWVQDDILGNSDASFVTNYIATQSNLKKM